MSVRDLSGCSAGDGSQGISLTLPEPRRREFSPPRPLRILLVVDTPWDQTLGAARVQIELAEQFRALGHIVDHFSYDEAYSSGAPIPRLAGLTRWFPVRAARHIRRHAESYDVIDARHGSVVASKRTMRFRGLLVTRSTGLPPIYEREFLAPQRRLGYLRARPLTRPLRWAERRLTAHRSALAFARSDLVNVLNADELRYCRNDLGAAGKTVMHLHGLTRDRMTSFRESQNSPRERLANPRVAFVGAWSRRKGAGDIGAIVRAVRQRVGTARFAFLGTGCTRQQVLADIGVDGEWIDVRPHFESDELPALLADATVGLLPSYVEGFPFSVIEMLAAGLPVVAYDAPGSREVLSSLDASLLVPRGDVLAVGGALIELLALGDRDYEQLSKRATCVADALRWEAIAEATIDEYRERLARLASAR